MQAHGSLERDDEDVYFDDESAEVVIQSLRLGDDQDSSLFTNSNWFAFEDDRVANDLSANPPASPLPDSDETDDVIVGENKDLADPTSSKSPDSSDPITGAEGSENGRLGNGPTQDKCDGGGEPSISTEESVKAAEWVEWRETPDSGDMPGDDKSTSAVRNGELEVEREDKCGQPDSNDPMSNNLVSEPSTGSTPSVEDDEIDKEG